jgi:hypothetical protein
MAKYIKREFGELQVSSNGDQCIKITAKPEVLDALDEGMFLFFEDPKVKYDRLIANDTFTEEKKDKFKWLRDNIPKFFIKRVIAHIKIGD